MTNKEAIQTLKNAVQSIVNEMFQNGAEEGCRIWEDTSHPLQQAVAILLNAKVLLRQQDPAFLKEAAAFLAAHV